MPEPRVAVVGGGITGLATAYYLRRAGMAATVLEAGENAGGKIQTEELAGVPVERGPDTFLARVPWAVDLCRELGLGEELIEPATGKAFLWTGGRLRPLPGRHVLGVPVALRPLLDSGVLSRRPWPAPCSTSSCPRAATAPTPPWPRWSAGAWVTRWSTASSTRWWAASTPAGPTS
jgi:protoporphyrinogen oxidase